MRFTPRRSGLLAVVAVIAVPLAMPSLAAAKTSSDAAEGTAKSAQTAKRVNSRVTRAVRTLNNLRRQLDTLDRGVQNEDVPSLRTAVQGLQGAAAALPGILGQLGSGLQTVGSGLSTLAGATQAIGGGVVILSKQTNVGVQLQAGGNNIAGCFGQSGPLPASGNGVTFNIRCVAPAGAANAPVTAVATCRSNKTNVTGSGSATCANARIMTLTSSPIRATASPPNAAQEGFQANTGAVSLPNRNPLIATSANQAAFPAGLTSQDTNTVNLSAAPTAPGLPGPQVIGGNPVIPATHLEITVQAVDSNPDLTGNAANNGTS